MLDGLKIITIGFEGFVTVDRSFRFVAVKLKEKRLLVEVVTPPIPRPILY